MDLRGSVQAVGLPASKPGNRHLAVSRDGRWAYVIENGRDSAVEAERIIGRSGGDAVASSSGHVRQPRGADLVWQIDAGRDFRFTHKLERESGLLMAGEHRVQFVPDGAAGLAWSRDWHDQLHRAPGTEIVRVAKTGLITIPVMNANEGRANSVKSSERAAMGGLGGCRWIRSRSGWSRSAIGGQASTTRG